MIRYILGLVLLSLLSGCYKSIEETKARELYCESFGFSSILTITEDKNVWSVSCYDEGNDVVYSSKYLSRFKE